VPGDRIRLGSRGCSLTLTLNLTLNLTLMLTLTLTLSLVSPNTRGGAGRRGKRFSDTPACFRVRLRLRSSATPAGAPESVLFCRQRLTGRQRLNPLIVWWSSFLEHRAFSSFERSFWKSISAIEHSEPSETTMMMCPPPSENLYRD
jgi:hypothetical protein